MVLAAPLHVGPTPTGLQAQVGASGAQQLGPGGHRGLPGEEHSPIDLADEDGVAGVGAGLDKLVLDPGRGQAVGEVADGLVIGEVGLTHPALGALPADLVDLPLAGMGQQTHLGDALLLPPPDRRGPDDGARLTRTVSRTGLAVTLGRGRSGLPGPLDLPGQGEGQGAQPCVRDRGDDVDRQSPGLDVGAHELGELGGVGDIDLVEHHDAGALHEGDPAGEGGVVLLLAEALGVGRELGLNGVQVGEGVAPRLEGGAVQDVDDDGTALDVPQEVKSQTFALGGSGDESGDVGDGVAHVAGLDDPEVGDEGREGVVGDLGAGGAHGGDEGGLAGAGVAHQGDVGNGLELQGDVLGLTGLSQEVEAGGLSLGGGQGEVAASAGAALGDDDAGALPHEVGDDLTARVLDDGALGNGQDEVLAVSTAAPVPHAGGAVAGPLVRGAVVAQQGRHPGVDGQDDVTAMTAVAAVGPGQGLELLTVHGGATVAAVAAGHVEDHSVNEAGHGVSCESGIAREGGRQVPSALSRRGDVLGAQASGSTTLTTRRPRKVPNSTLPAAVANRVSSLPRPTLRPGWKWVPRWRTMISPALTNWPPKRLTPRRCALESRPLREEPRPFLCAMVEGFFLLERVRSGCPRTG